MPASMLPLMSYEFICLHPTSLYQRPASVVTGEAPPVRQLPCESARSGLHENSCGPEGRYWEEGR
jgi:hypothetical protein